MSQLSLRATRSTLGFGVMLTCAFLFIGCKPTVTCDPSKGPTNAGCPNSAPICDPSGICRQICGNACPTGQVCDSSGTGAYSNITNICQDLCDSSCPDINGNSHVCWTYTELPAAGDTKNAPTPIKMCKRIIAGPPATLGTVETPNWCVNPAFSKSTGSSGSGTAGYILCLAQ